MSMLLALDLMQHKAGAQNISIFEDFSTGQNNGWSCARASSAMNLATNNQFDIYSNNQIRFQGANGLWIEPSRSNLVPKTDDYSSWIKTGVQSVTFANDFSLVSNDQVATVNLDTSSGLHNIYTFSASTMGTFAIIMDFGTLNNIRVELSGRSFNIPRTGTMPADVKKTGLNEQWAIYTFENLVPGDNLVAVYALDSAGNVNWTPAADQSFRLYSPMGVNQNFPMSYVKNTGVGIVTWQGDSISKAPYPGFDGNNFEMVIRARLPFSKADIIASPINDPIFEFGSNNDLIKLYIALDGNITFDRFANGLSSFVQAASTWVAGDIFNITIAQTTADGIGIAIGESSFFNSSANAKAVSNMPSGNMFLGGAPNGLSQFPCVISSINYIAL